jgi:hypothetical protein
MTGNYCLCNHILRNFSAPSISSCFKLRNKLCRRKRGQYDWSKFRAISRLDRKQDEAMTEYYRAFCTMLKRVCGMKLTEEEGQCAGLFVNPVSNF